MSLLVGFANRFYAPELVLGILDTDSGTFCWVMREDFRRASQGMIGVGAICRYRDHYLVALGGPARLVVLDREFHVKSVGDLSRIRRIHCMSPRGDEILAASTGTDEVYGIRLDSSFEVTSIEKRWALDSRAFPEDRHHVNSVAAVGDRALLTMFGPKAQGGWGATMAGQLFDLDSGRTLLAPLHHPHTAYALNGSWVVCESGTGMLHFEGGRSIHVGGYVRGLADDPRHLYVGRSGTRLRSASEGTLNAGPDDSKAAFPPGVAVVDRETSQVLRNIDLSTYGGEIFDLVWIHEKVPEDLHKADAKELQIESLQEQIWRLSRRAEDDWIPARLRRLGRRGLLKVSDARRRLLFRVRP